MCRACTDANPRRCPSSSGELRSARDRGAYAATKAAGLTGKPKGRSGVKGGLIGSTPEPAAPENTVPSILDVKTLSDGVADLYYPESMYSDAAKALIQKYGSRDLAVVALGDAITARAEMHAGVTADDVQALQGTAIQTAEEGKRIVRTDLGMFTMHREMERLKAEFDSLKRRGAPLQQQIEVGSAHNAVREQFLAAEKDSRYKAAKLAVQRAQTGTHGESGEALLKLREGYSKALSEIRAMGGEVNYSDKTTAKAREGFASASAHYPTDWIDTSNTHPAPTAVLTTKRAHYQGGEMKVERKKVPVAFPTLGDEGEDLTVKNSRYDTYEKDANQENVPAGKVRWLNLSQESRMRTPGGSKPAGPGWEAYTDDKGREFWRRPRTRMKNVVSNSGPEIWSNKSDQSLPGIGPYEAVASHELGHRMEHTVPGVSDLEREFLKRRTTLADGTRERMVDVNGSGKREAGWADSFPVAYMGRNYAVGNKPTESFEILSVGMESMFGGHHGGFVGAGRYNRDDESRSFILGLLASAGRR